MAERRHYLGPLTDSSRWDRIQIRPDDAIVVTPPKSGTTWMQTIVALMLSGDPDIAPEPSLKMPWVDMQARDIAEVADRLNTMPHRRCMKSHTPLDGLPLHGHAQYLCVFRHPLDAHFSFRKHVENISLPLFADAYPEDDTKGLTFQNFLNGSATGYDCDAMPLAHIIRHYQAAQAVSDRLNVTLFHYADMLRDLSGTFDKLASLLGVTYPASLMDELVSVATFDNMKQNADRYAPGGGTGFYKVDSDFFHSATSGKWHGRLSEAEFQAYDAMMQTLLPAADRAWLEYGTVG